MPPRAQIARWRAAIVTIDHPWGDIVYASGMMALPPGIGRACLHSPPSLASTGRAAVDTHV
jgi:hypothetical protein